MSKRVDSIIKEMKEEVEERKTMIKRYENSIKALSSESVERLDIIKKLEELNKMRENHEIGSYKDQLTQLEVEYDMANKNKKMFYRLWIRWANESRDI